MALPPEIEAAFRRQSAALDETWQLVRGHDAERDATEFRVDTLSTSLANPEEHHVEIMLSSAQANAGTSSERDAVAAVTRAALAQGLLQKAAFDRLMKALAP